jgi:hypothetical protein
MMTHDPSIVSANPPLSSCGKAVPYQTHMLCLPLVSAARSMLNHNLEGVIGSSFAFMSFPFRHCPDQFAADAIVSR